MGSRPAGTGRQALLNLSWEQGHDSGNFVFYRVEAGAG